MFLDLQEGILLEFTERAATSERNLPYGFRVVPENKALPTGADYRAMKLCPDCGQAPQASRIRCAVCAVKHAVKCKAYHARKKAA